MVGKSESEKKKGERNENPVRETNLFLYFKQGLWFFDYFTKEYDPQASRGLVEAVVLCGEAYGVTVCLMDIGCSCEEMRVFIYKERWRSELEWIGGPWEDG